ncbi:acyloxyacyl hydrolase [Pseudoalteromonas gelatinilytica]|uniref:Lipid A deacylase n=2 Tax=Pseudoalteromonas gelatinilytica TaxID=1703256 RepID=A0A3A3EGG4_9GAMM|nr:acyloxyacyl hydrolase [Pseudoalteromonas profundi]
MKLKRPLKALMLSAAALLAAPIYAASNHGYAIDYIQGEGDVKGLKLAYQYHIPNEILPLQHARLYFESSFNIWEYGKHNKHQTNVVLAMSPVIQYPVFNVKSMPVYVEFGIGVSLLDDTHFAGKNVSTHYQFEDRLGLVADLGSGSTLALRYLHYSNAGFKSPNPGLDFISLSYARRF